MDVRQFTVYDTLERNARNHRDLLALVTEAGDELSFAALKDRVDRLATGLHALGLRKGDRLLIVAQNSARYVELYFACARQGVIAYPVNWRLQAGEVEMLATERAMARTVVFDASCAELLGGEALARQFDHRFCLEGARDGAQPFDDLYVAPGAELVERADVTSDDAFAVIATAAVDVIPRGAILSHENIWAANVQEIAAYGLGTHDRNLVALPLFHISALGHMLAHLHAGGANAVIAKYDAAQAVEWIDRHSITHISDFPPVLQTLLDAAKEQGSELETLRYVSGLDAPDTMQRLHDETGAIFMTGFGQVETSGFVTLQNAKEKLGCAGKPAELASVQLVGEDEREVATGEEGEIVVRGPLVFSGYDGQPDVTEYTFRNGWHHTGDIGRFDDDGSLYYVRRKPEKELIKPGGENVYPAEVETALLSIDGVRAACVFGVPDDRWGEAIQAVLETDEELSRDAVREHVGSKIARFKRPEHVVLTAQLPRTEDGEVDRERVKELHAVG